MMKLRASEERGRADFGWLNSRHSFSFGGYFDPEHLGFGALRVINEDRVIGGAGFDTHGHRDMEILSYVLEGGLEHKDSLGVGAVIRPGELQRMTAGSGVRHSEFNASKSDPVHFLQIWLIPEAEGLEPSYEQKAFVEEDRQGQLRLLASRDGRDGAVTVHQDVELSDAALDAGQDLEVAIKPGRKIWLQVIDGELEARSGKGLAMVEAGDGLGVWDESALRLKANRPSKVLVFDLAA